MSKTLFKERYRELPSFQLAMRLVEYWVKQDMSFEEVATRMLMFQESPLNWDTLCHNCAALMDKNYEQYCEIERLKERLNALEEDLAYADNEIRELNEELRCAEARFYNEGL